MKKAIWIGVLLTVGAVFLLTGIRGAKSDEADLVLIGTELEGMYMARRAHDLGLNVLVLDTEAQPGGQLLRGEMLYLDETFDDRGRSLVQGSIKQLFDRYYEGEIRKLGEFRAYFSELAEDIPLIDSVQLMGIQQEDGKIRSLTYRTDKGKEKTVRADYFADNTDSAELIRLLGIQRNPGLEALYKSPQVEYMSATYMMKFKNADWETFSGKFWEMNQAERMTRYGPETYVDGNLAYGFPPIVARYEPKHPDMVNLRGLNILNQRDGEIIINALQVYDVDPGKPETVERALAYARDEMPRIRDHLRQHISGFENLEINGEPGYLYIREYNHYPTEYTLEASDLLAGRMHWDNVSVGGYFIDIQGSRSNREGFAIGRPDKYGMPLRSYLLKDADNVIVTGKLVGATPVAYGSARIQPNGALAAESIGILLARLIPEGIDLKRVTPERMAAFQREMRDTYGVELQPGQGTNKIAVLTDSEISELNAGHITLLGRNRARTLPFIRVYHNNVEVKFTAHRPVIIDGKTWVPAEELLTAFGARDIRVYLDRNELTYTHKDDPERVRAIFTPIQILNNRMLVNLRDISELFGFKAAWDNPNRLITIYSDEPETAPAAPASAL